MKKLILLSCLLMAGNSFAGELQHFSEIKSALLAGKSIHIVTDFNKCTKSSKNKLLFVGIFTPNEIQVKDDYIAASLTHFTVNNPHFPDASVFEFARYTITDSNNIVVSYQTLDAHYIPLTPKSSMTCKLGEEAKIYID